MQREVFELQTLAAVSPAEQNWIHLEIKLFYEMSKKNKNKQRLA